MQRSGGLCLGTGASNLVVRIERTGQSEKVPPHLHPLKCGYPWQLYSVNDYVTPICDSMTKMHDAVYGTGLHRVVVKETMRKERQRLQDSSCKQTQSARELPAFSDDDVFKNEFRNTSFVTATTERGVLCPGCKTKDISKFRRGEGDQLVCACGVVGKRYCYGTDYKETHGTDQGASRADAAPSQDGPRVQSSAISTSAKRKHKLGYAHENSTRAADAVGVRLSKGNTRKLTSIIEAVEKMIKQVSPVDKAIARKIRMDAEMVFKASIEHKEICNHRECQKALFNKPASVIAAKSFVYTVEQLSVGEGISGISKQTVIMLQERVQRSPVFNQRDNATQHQSCLAMIAALSQGNNKRVCATLDPCYVVAATKGDVPIKRQKSDVDSSPTMKLRDEIRYISASYGYSLKVQKAATMALQNADIFKVLFTGADELTGLGSFTKACVIMQCITDSTGCDRGVSSRLLRENAHRMQADGVRVAAVVERVKSALSACVEALIDDDDELY